MSSSKEKIISLKHYILYHSFRLVSWFVRLLPLKMALAFGRGIGRIYCFFDAKHRKLAYINLKIAFSNEKSPEEIAQIYKDFFKNIGQNMIELMRMPMMNKDKFNQSVDVVGAEHLEEALKGGHGTILLAMHFGSWEIASVAAAMLGHPYKYFVKPQEKYTQLNELLNSYRECGGSVVLSRGMGNRDLLKSLKNNEVIGMVVDQGGRDGMLTSFFGRMASMSVGAIRIGIKWNVPLCFAIIIRQEKSSRHQLIIHPPFKITKSSDASQAISDGLSQVVKVMESYLRKYPSEYMWVYKIWKFTNEKKITILEDEKTGHLRQSQKVAEVLKEGWIQKGFNTCIEHKRIEYKSAQAKNVFKVISFLFHPFIKQKRISWLKYFVTESSYKNITSIISDAIVSCGSPLAAINLIISKDIAAKSIVILKPGWYSIKNFHMVFLPYHDRTSVIDKLSNVRITMGAPNLVTDHYLKTESQKLLNRYSHLKNTVRLKIGVLIGGDSKILYISENQIKSLIHQLNEIARELNADLLITTSRRTSVKIENMLFNSFKKNNRCVLFINANKDSVPEAVGGIMGLSDYLIVSGDSISMISEAASSGKKTIVFTPEFKFKLNESNKHLRFIENLNRHAHIISTDVNHVKSAMYQLSKNKFTTKKLNDDSIINDGIQSII